MVCPKGSIITIDERFFGIADAAIETITASDPDSNDTLVFTVTPALPMPLVPISVVPVRLDSHAFKTNWNVTVPQAACGITLTISLRDVGGLNATTKCNIIVQV